MTSTEATVTATEDTISGVDTGTDVDAALTHILTVLNLLRQ